MKYLHRLLALLLLSAGVFSCQKEYSLENPTSSTSTTAQWEFKEAGVLFKGPVDTATIDTIGTYKFLTILGRSDDGSSQISLQIFGANLNVGSYKTPFSLFSYVKGTTSVYQTDQTAADSFTIVITKLDTAGVTGTFSGKALSGNTGKKIVDGKFTAVFKKSVIVTPPASTDSGQVMLWSKVGCGGGTSTNPIAVTVGGTRTGSITKFFTTEPTTCDPLGSFNLKLPVGTYPWVAKCGTDSVKGTLTVTKNGCTKQLVDFTAVPPVSMLDYFPTTTNSNWTSKYDTSAAGIGDTTYTFSKGTTLAAGGNTYSIFGYTDFAAGYTDTLYYRKANNTYYQYYVATTNILGFDTPVPIEIPFLKDNVAAGSTFSSTTYSGTITLSTGPLAVQQKVDATILEKATSVTVGSLSFTDVIKVRLSYKAIAGGTTQEIYREEQWFAKGIGLIRYLEFYDAPYTVPTYILNTTRYKIFP